MTPEERVAALREYLTGLRETAEWARPHTGDEWDVLSEWTIPTSSEAVYVAAVPPSLLLRLIDADLALLDMVHRKVYKTKPECAGEHEDGYDRWPCPFILSRADAWLGSR